MIGFMAEALQELDEQQSEGLGSRSANFEVLVTNDLFCAGLIEP